MKFMKKRQVSIIVITLSIIVMGYLTMLFLISQKSLPERRNPVVPDRYVKAEKVVYQTIKSPVLSTGRMSSSQTLDVVSEASGKIEQGDVALKTGEAFKKGDILFKIYDDEVQLVLKAKKSKFMNTIALLLPDIKLDFPDYYNHFVEFFNKISIDKDLPSLPVLKNQKLKIYLAARNLLSDYFIIKGDELRLKRHTVRAPFDGAFLLVNQEVGSYANMNARLAKIINTEKLELVVSVKEPISKWVSKGDKVHINAKNSDKLINGVVVRKSDFINENTQSRSIYIRMKNDRDRIVWGQYLNVKFEGKSISNVMEIPRSAIFNHNQVFIVSENRLFKRDINIIKENSVSVIFDGLKQDVYVVTEPLIDVRENTEVKILK